MVREKNNISDYGLRLLALFKGLVFGFLVYHFIVLPK